MKKIKRLTLWTGLFMLLIGTHLSLSAQSFRQGEITISPGVGLFNLGVVGYTGFNSFPAVITGEYGLTDQFSAGAFAGVRYWFGTIDLSPSVALGVRGTAHLFPILNSNFDTDIDDSQFDVYLSANIGLEVRPEYLDASATRFILGPVLGGRFYIAENFGFFLELGTGALSYTSGGIVIRVGGN